MTVPIVRRAQWGARYPNGDGPGTNPFTEYWLHHDVSGEVAADAGLAAEVAHVQLLERIGQQRFGRGISYTYPVARSGRLFEGHTVDRRGTHTKGRNSIARAFVLFGNYSHRPVTPEQVETIARRMVEDHRAGRSTTHQLSGGHRDAPGSTTDCPGDAGEAAVPDINRRARQLWAEGYPNAPTPPPTPAGRITLMHQLVRLNGTDPVYLTDLISRRWVQSTAELKLVQTQLKARGLPSTVTVVSSLAPYGVLVGPEPK